MSVRSTVVLSVLVLAGCSGGGGGSHSQPSSITPSSGAPSQPPTPSFVVFESDQIPDNRLRDCINETAETENIEKAEQLSVLICPYDVPRGVIGSLDGLELLTSLEVLELVNENRLAVDADRRFSDLSPLGELSALRYLNIPGASVTNLDPLRGLGELRTLGIAGTLVRDLAPLSDLPWLQVLDISHLNAGIAEIESLQPLGALANLRELYASYNHLQSAQLQHLATLTQLEVLHLVEAELNDMSFLAGMSGLRELNLSGCVNCLEWNREIPAVIGTLNNLRVLYLQAAGNLFDIDSLAPLVNLRVLDLRYSTIGDIDLAPLSGMANLEELYFRHARFTSEQPLTNLTNLVRLGLDFVSIYDPSTQQTAIDLSALQNASRLQSLSLDGAIFDNLPALWGLPLESLVVDLQTTGQAPPDLGIVQGFSELRLLTWESNWPPVTDFQPILGLGQLEVLSLYGTRLNTSVAPLAQLRGLRGLNLTSTDISDSSGVEELIALPALERLCIGGNIFSNGMEQRLSQLFGRVVSREISCPPVEFSLD